MIITKEQFDESAVRDTLKRYFVSNKAPIFHVRLHRWWSAYIPCRGGNFHGFYLGPFQVTWRIPYVQCWRYDGRRWVINEALTQETQP